MRMIALQLSFLLTASAGPLWSQTQDSSSRSGWLAQPDVARYLEYFTGPGRDRMSSWLNRGTQYRTLIGDRLDRAGLPTAFGSLPIIESGFSNTAVSRAGAVGMWQFIPETARQYGLRVDGWVDERRDPTRATDAAVRHLGDLRRAFGGDALLAAAAYNSGTGRVSRSLRRLQNLTPDSLPAPTDSAFFALSANELLPKETRNYVPQLLAAAAIVEDPSRFGFAVDTTEAPAVDSVLVTRSILLAAAERALGLDRLTLANLNPHYFRGVTPPGGSWLRVPAGFAEQLVSRLATLPAVARARFEHRATVGQLIWVKRGDTVAELALRHRVTERALRRVNALPSWYRLRIGQALRLPQT